MRENEPIVGIIANPVSARDIRRIVAHAGNLQITDRANIVLRLLSGLGAVGVKHVLIMPEKAGIRQHVMRGLQRSEQLGEARFPKSVEYLEMPITSSTQDTLRATMLMRDRNVAALIVLGGDGTHRAVISACKDIPIAGVSTGTNNAFPKFTEPTTVGMAVGLAVMRKELVNRAFTSNKMLEIDVSGRQEIALVDVAIVAEQYIGARALWRAKNFKELFVSFAETEVIGMSAVAGLLDPVGRDVPEGRCIVFDDSAEPGLQLQAAIAPGIIEQLGIHSWHSMRPGISYPIQQSEGSIALDGERELSFSRDDSVSVTLRTNAFQTIDITTCMKFGARNHFLRDNRKKQNNKETY